MTASASGQDVLLAGWLTSADWWEFRPELVADGKWNEAYDRFFLPRLNLRYLEPIGLLQEHGTFRGEGFSIVSIQCAVMEFLAACRWGLSYVRTNPGLHEYNRSGDLFARFLTDVAPFSTMFDQASAKSFYAGVRCGLLHEASTKDGWTIWAKGDVAVDTQKRIVYRDPLHDTLLQYVRTYRDELLESSDLQLALLRKFDQLAS